MAKDGIMYNDAVLKKRLNKVKSKLGNPKELMQLIGAQAEKAIENNFDREADIKGRKWKDLSEITLSNRRKGGAGAKILRDTGRLSRIESNATKKDVLVGTTVNYGKIHNEGGYTTFNGVKKYVPPRPWLYINQREKQKIKKIVKLYLEKAIK